MKVLVINSGSSSLKYQLIDMDTQTLMAKGLVERIGIEGSNLEHSIPGRDKIKIEEPIPDHGRALAMVIEALTNSAYGAIASMKEIDAVGHRVLHGGEKYTKSIVIDDTVIEGLKECIPLGPLHMPANIMGIEACREALEGVPMVAVFDTAFHQTMPKEAYTYAIPKKYYEKYKIRKYGFHGTSHKFVSLEAAKLLDKPLEQIDLISAHIGNGASVSAVKNGKCIENSMGFTPLDGLVMGTRSGSIDPAVLKFLADKEGMTIDELDTMLNKQSGLLGLTGVSSDFRDVAKGVEEGDEALTDVFNLFIYRIATTIGAYTVSLGGFDALVFTAGVGENSALMRGAVCKKLACLGVELDEEKNMSSCRDARIISTENSKVKVMVIPTNEELMIAKETVMLTQAQLEKNLDKKVSCLYNV